MIAMTHGGGTLPGESPRTVMYGKPLTASMRTPSIGRSPMIDVDASDQIGRKARCVAVIGRG